MRSPINGSTRCFGSTGAQTNGRITGGLAVSGLRGGRGLHGKVVAEVRRFLDKWVPDMRPVYMACSLPDTFAFPEDSIRGRLLHEAVLPAAGITIFPCR